MQPAASYLDPSLQDLHCAVVRKNVALRVWLSLWLKIITDLNHFTPL